MFMFFKLQLTLSSALVCTTDSLNYRLGIILKFEYIKIYYVSTFYFNHTEFK